MTSAQIVACYDTRTASHTVGFVGPGKRRLVFVRSLDIWITENMRIIYAEDDPLVRENIAGLLVSQGVDVHEARDGGEAILLCRTFHPDAVLLDLGMPHIDGFETARRIRELDMARRIRLVALTAHGDASHQRLAKLAGFDEFLTKPISAETLIGALSRWH